MKLARRATLLIAATAVAFPLLGTTSAHAACTIGWTDPPVVRYSYCAGNCSVWVLGDQVFTCP